jgi:uncharacterized membrane protein YhiD involved in acid resistance
MQTLSTLEFVARLAAGLGFGALIGAELQWRAGWRGLRTNVLVAAGSTLFVLYSDISGSLNPTQVAAYVMSGRVSGRRVILRDGFNVREGSETRLTAHLLLDGDAAAGLEQLVARLSLEPDICAVHWHTADDPVAAPAPPPAPARSGQED